MRCLFGWLLALGIAGNVWAGADAALIARQDLLEQPALLAKSVGQATAGAGVRVLEQSRGWVRVETGGV